jgi:ethanolamine utilization protein EutN
VIIGRIVGNVVATVKYRKYEGQKLLQVLPLDLRRRPSRPPITAIDLVDAGPGDEVLVCLEGKSAMDAVGLGDNPVDAVILAVVDRVKLVDTEGKDPWTRD